MNRLQAWLQDRGQDLNQWLKDPGEGSRVRHDTDLAEYFTALYRAGQSPATISLAAAAVRFIFKTTDQPSPAGPRAIAVLRGIRREGKNRGRGQVSGIRWGQADTAAAIAANEGQDLKGLRDASILSLMSDGMLRVSELVALWAADLTIEPDGSGRLTIRSSKTDQEGDGAEQYIGALTVRRVLAWMAAAGFTAGPLFRRVPPGWSRRQCSPVPLRGPGHHSGQA